MPNRTSRTINITTATDPAQTHTGIVVSSDNGILSGPPPTQVMIHVMESGVFKPIQTKTKIIIQLLIQILTLKSEGWKFEDESESLMPDD